VNPSKYSTFLVLALPAVAASFSFAQQTATLPINIHVTDMTGAVVPHAWVRVIPSPDPEKTKVETDEGGVLSLQLKPGGYGLFVRSSGFVPVVRHMEVPTWGLPHSEFDVALKVATGGGPIVVYDESYKDDLFFSAYPYHKDRMITPAELRAMPHSTVIGRNPDTNSKEVFKGVRLSELLMRFGAPLGTEFRDVALVNYLVASGGSNQVVFSLAEVDPSMQSGEVLVADELNGKPLDSGSGPFMLVVAKDKHRNRWVTKLNSIAIRTP
jgi:hypothetical protein